MCICCCVLRSLLSQREETRPIEVAARVLFKPVTWAFPTLLSIPTSTVGQAMLNKTIMPVTEKTETLDNKAIHRISAN